MKVYAINGGPRKGKNTDQMLDSFIKGIAETREDAEIEKVYVYDLKASGCKSCYGCRIKTLDPGQCIVKDGSYELLRKVKNCDGIVIASPIYWWDVTAELRGFLERLFYSMTAMPEDKKRHIEAAFIYTMNQPQEVMEKKFTPHFDALDLFMEDAFGTKPERVYSFETLHFDDPNRFVGFSKDLFDYRTKHKEEQFPVDLQNAYEAGRRMAEKL